MKQQYEFKKFPILATVLAAVCLLFAVVGVTASLINYEYYYTGPMVTGLLLIITAVLVIAGLTTGRPLLLKVISIIICIAVNGFASEIRNLMYHTSPTIKQASKANDEYFLK